MKQEESKKKKEIIAENTQVILTRISESGNWIMFLLCFVIGKQKSITLFLVCISSTDTSTIDFTFHIKFNTFPPSSMTKHDWTRRQNKTTININKEKVKRREKNFKMKTLELTATFKSAKKKRLKPFPAN